MAEGYGQRVLFCFAWQPFSYVSQDAAAGAASGGEEKLQT